MKENNSGISCDVFEATETYHHDVILKDISETSYIWENHENIPFDELIISWNAMRPQYGGFDISVSVKLGQWTPWMSYAFWNAQGQQSGNNIFKKDSQVRIKEDIVAILNEKQAFGFRIRIQSIGEATLDEFYSLHVCASRLSDYHFNEKCTFNQAVDLQVPLVSQLTLPHPRHRDMCSPTSTSAMVSFLMEKNRIDPIFFASQARDEASDIYGNWVLNTAQASSILGKNWCCWVQRLKSFDEIYKQLAIGIPVVVSIKGPLRGSSLPPNSEGHLILVKGFLPKENKVLCMDPAFPCDAETNVSYHLKDFINAWSRRQYVAYLVQKRSLL